jgi:hypothetical protein
MSLRNFFFLFTNVSDSKVLIGGSWFRIKALHDRVDSFITVKDNLNCQNHQVVLHFICVVNRFGLRRRNIF